MYRLSAAMLLSLVSVFPSYADAPVSTRRSVGREPNFVAAGNPVMPGADPHAAVFGKQVWVYPTRGGARFYAFSSPDLKHWERHGPVLDFANVSWIDADGAPYHSAWAPAIAEKNGKFYFYYAVGPQYPTWSRIGVAVGDSPAGPFKDSGKPLLTGEEGFEAIDPMVFTDPRTQTSYLYTGGSAGAKLRIYELGADMVSLARRVPIGTPPEFTEAPFVHERKGTYYLSYSHGSWQSASYSVHYATSDTPVGPWKYRGALLTSDKRHKGPGHHSFFKVPDRDEWYIVYHRWNDRADNGPFRGSREIAIERLRYEADGRIRPVVMTDKLPKMDLGRK